MQYSYKQPCSRHSADAAKAIEDLLISIQPQYVDQIVQGRKTIEFRRKFPCSNHIHGKKIWIYSTSPIRAVIAVAEVEAVQRMPVHKLWDRYNSGGCIAKTSFYSYFQGTSHGCAILLAKVERLTKHITLKSLKKNGFHIPQSYRYVTADIYPLLIRAYGQDST